MGSTVFGVKIILQDKSSPVSENTTIGLYNVAADNSEIRWIQNAVSGVSTWKEGVIAKAGLKPFSNEIDLTKGGAVAYPGKGSVTIDDYAGTWKALVDTGFKFDGLIVEIHVFYGSTPVRLRTYACKEPSFDSATMTIPFEGIKRTANILNVVNSYQFPNAGETIIGKTTPATFGKHFPKYDTDGNIVRNSLAKFIRIQDRIDENVYTNENLSISRDHPEIKIFPVVQLWLTGSPSYPIGVQIELTDDAIDIGADPVYVSDTYVIITSGTGKDEINEVDYISVTGGTAFNIFCKNAFKTTPSFASNDTRSWVQLVKIYRNFTDDRFPCKDFLDDDGNSISVPEIFLKDSQNKLQRIADYGFSVAGINKNEVDIDGSQYDTDIDTLESFLVLPCSNLRREDAADLSEWDTDAAGAWFANFTNKLADGLYLDRAYSASLSITSTFGLVDADKAYDKDTDTYAAFDSGIYFPSSVFLPDDFWLCKVLKFDIPEIPANVDIEGIYLGIKMHSKLEPNIWGWLTGTDRQTVRVVFKRFAHNKTTDVALYGLVFDEGAVGVRFIDDIPDFYTGGSGQNASFYRETTPTGDVYSEIKGYTLVGAFKLTDATLKDWRTYKEAGLIMRRFVDKDNVDDSGLAVTDTLRVYELTIIVKLNSQSMKDEIFSPASGRKFNSTFDGRKTSTDLISKPQELFEHICRLQDYRDKYVTPASGWGLQYASGALIHTASFDKISDAREPATQIFDLDEGYTDTVKSTMAREFALANWQDANGYERVLALPTYRLDPVHTVTLDDVMDRTKIKVSDQKRDSIYSEPFARYQKNPASGEYDKQISVKNTSATYYLSRYVDGVESAAEAEDLWRTCHSLALKSYQTNKPPTDMTDLQWANGPGGYTIALRHLQNWTRWQGLQEIEFPVHFNLAASWQECTPINVLFSHATGNVSRPALVERAEVNPNHPYDVMIRAIMYA